MRSFVSQSAKNLRPSGIRRYFDIAASMNDVISLGIGQPDFATPTHITQKGVECLHNGGTGYTANNGTHELREAIAAYIQRLYGLSYDPDDQILVTVGVSEAMFLALKAILDPGDEVLVVEPCFVANAAAVEMAGGVPVTVDTHVEHDFQGHRGQSRSQRDPAHQGYSHQLPQQPHRRGALAGALTGDRCRRPQA